MVHKPIYHSDEPPTFDEGWWASLLADEQRYSGAPNERLAQSTQLEAKPTAAHLASKAQEVDWERVHELYEQDETICLPVTGYNRGGLLVEGEGLYGFVPLSHLVALDANEPEAERDAKLAAYVGEGLCLKVIECDAERGRIVFSERAAVAGAGRRNQLFEGLTIGQCVHGQVTNVTAFGVFVDLGGVEGLIHVSELSWGRVRHPGDVVRLGETVDALVINMDRDRCRVALSLKRLRPNPWETAERRYHPGQLIDVVVTSIVQFGAFARLEEGLDGLIHVTEMGLSGEAPDPQQVLHEGQAVRVRILHVDALKQRLGLSLRLTE